MTRPGRIRPRHRPLLVGFLGLALLSAGCGGDDDDEVTSPTTGTRPTRAGAGTPVTATSTTVAAVAPTPAPPAPAPPAPATRTAGPPPATNAPATTTALDRPPCPGPSVALERAAPADARVCVTMSLSATTLRSGVDVVQGTLTAENRSRDRVDISHPSGCPIWWGLYEDGRHVAGGPSTCPAGGPVADSLGPQEVRRWTFELHTCYGRTPGTAGCTEGAAVAGAYAAAAGLNIGSGDGHLAVDRVWFAPEQPVVVTA